MTAAARAPRQLPLLVLAFTETLFFALWKPPGHAEKVCDFPSHGKYWPDAEPDAGSNAESMPGLVSIVTFSAPVTFHENVTSANVSPGLQVGFDTENETTAGPVEVLPPLPFDVPPPPVPVLPEPVLPEPLLPEPVLPEPLLPELPVPVPLDPVRLVAEPPAAVPPVPGVGAGAAASGVAAELGADVDVLVDVTEVWDEAGE